MKRSFVLAFLLLVLVQARASELFIWISSPGTFEVTVGEQFQKSSKGKFRFFDLDSGYVSIKVKKQGLSGAFYEGRVQVHPGKCMVVEVGQNDLYHVSDVDCSGNYDLPSGDSGQLVGNNQPGSTDYSKYHGTDQASSQSDSNKTDYSKYHGTDQASSQNDSIKTDYSKYHGTDQANSQNNLDKTDYSKYHNNTGQDKSRNNLDKTDQSNYHIITDQGNNQNNSNKTDYGNDHNNTGKGSSQNNSGSGSQPNNSNKTGNSNHNNSGNADYGNYHNNGGCDENSFNQMLETLRSKPFDSQKLEQAKAFAPKTHYTSSQVKRICELMNFDSNRLEFAKLAYDNTVDKENYSVVSKVFRFPNFSKDLDRYITSKR